MTRAGTAQPARMARSTSTARSVPAASPAAVSATTRYGDGCKPSDHGGCPGRPGSTGSMTDGPATATAKVHTMLAPMAMSPARPASIPSDLTRPIGPAGPAPPAPAPPPFPRPPPVPSAPPAPPGPRAPAVWSSAYGERPGHVGELVRPVQLGPQAGPGGPVRELHLN